MGCELTFSSRKTMMKSQNLSFFFFATISKSSLIVSFVRCYSNSKAFNNNIMFLQRPQIIDFLWVVALPKMLLASAGLSKNEFEGFDVWIFTLGTTKKPRVIIKVLQLKKGGGNVMRKERKTRAGNLQAFQDASLKLEPLKKVWLKIPWGYK